MLFYLLGFGYVWAAEVDDEPWKARLILSLCWPLIAGLVCFCYVAWYLVCGVLFFTTCKECKERGPQ